MQNESAFVLIPSHHAGKDINNFPENLSIISFFLKVKKCSGLDLINGTFTWKQNPAQGDIMVFPDKIQ
jgi:hypothetical protein